MKETKWVDCEYCGDEYPTEELGLVIEIDDFYDDGYREIWYCDSCREEIPDAAK